MSVLKIQTCDFLPFFEVLCQKSVNSVENVIQVFTLFNFEIAN